MVAVITYSWTCSVDTLTMFLITGSQLSSVIVQQSALDIAKFGFKLHARPICSYSKAGAAMLST